MEFKQDEFYIYIEKRSYFSQVFSKEEGNDGDWGTRGAESAIIRHVIIRLFVSDDSGIENNWPAQIFEQRTNGLESIPRVCMFANAQSPHCSWVRMPAQHWLLHCSLSLSLFLFHLWSIQQCSPLIYYTCSVHQENYRTCSSNSPLFLSLSLFLY